MMIFAQKTTQNGIKVTIFFEDGYFFVKAESEIAERLSNKCVTKANAMKVFDLWLSRWENVDIKDEVNFYGL